jgi:hypothetical protein
MEYRLLAVRPERGKRHRPSHGEYRQHKPRRSLRSEIRRYSITLGFGRYRYRFRGRHIYLRLEQTSASSRQRERRSQIGFSFASPS